ncbi:MAG TPA: hypothetical protein VIJ27_08825, partial [Mucilaginibacter sp.]
MNGTQFYNYLHQIYQGGQLIYDNFSFNHWLAKNDGTHSFQFNIPNNPPKSISQYIIVSAWNANQPIDDN